jgi:hypothetical protein
MVEHDHIAKDITVAVIKTTDIDFQNPEDPVVEFMENLENSEARLGEVVSWRVSHGKRRKISNMNIVRRQRASQLRATKDALDILRQHSFSEATFFKNEQGKIIGFKVDQDSQH